MNNASSEAVYSKDELQLMVTQMRQVVSAYYNGAVYTNCHPFIEFCGMMSKYVDICQRMANEGEDFTVTSVHSINPLRVEDHDIEYLAEKFACIFGNTLRANSAHKQKFFDLIG